MGDGGAQRIVLNYLNYFKNDKDIDFKLVVYDKCNNSYCNNVITENKFNVEYLNNKKSIFKYIPFVRKLCNLLTIRRTFQKAIEKFEPDIVHIHISPLLKFVLQPIINTNIPIRFITLHSNPLRYVGNDLDYIKRAYQKENFIAICLNEEQKKLAEKHYGFEKYEIVKNGIDVKKIKSQKLSKLKARENFNLEKDDFVIIGVGRLNKIKRFDLLIKIFKEVTKKENKAKLVIAGAGEEYTKLIDLANELNLSEKVIFLGNIDNTTELYCAADALAMTSESEASPLTLIEAQICNLHCVISDGVPKESIVTNKVKKMKKNASQKEWAQELLNVKYKGTKTNNLEEYDINNSCEHMKEVYIKYWKEYNEKK